MANQEALIIKDSGGTEADVTASNALKVDGSAVDQPIIITDGVDTVDVIPLAGSDALAVAVVDGSGNQVTSFVGTQYTEGDIDPTITGVAAMMEVSGNILVPIQGQIANGGYGMTTIIPGHESVDNSTTSVLGSGGIFTGNWEDVLNHGIVIITVNASHDSATDGFSVQFSTDGANIDNTDEFSIPGGIGKTFSFQAAARYIRVVYTNGATLQTYFRLQTIFKPSYAKPSSHRISDSLSLQDDAELVKAVIAGETTAGGGSFVNVKVNPSGTLQTAIADIADITGQSTMANSIPVVIASDQSAVPVSGTVAVSGTIPISAASLPLPTGAATSALQTQPGVDIGDVTVNNAAGASAVNIQDGGNSITVDGTVSVSGTVPISAVALPLPSGAATSALQTQPGVDIGDVTINNASGASAVNIQDGGNSITVDGTVTISGTVPVSATDLDIRNLVFATDKVDASGSTVVAAGDVAHGTADSGNPVKIGFKVEQALPTAEPDNDRVNGISDRYGRQLKSHIDPGMQIWKSANFTTTQTGGAIWTPTASTRVAITYLAISAYGTTAARCIIWFGAGGDTTYTAGTDQLLWAGSFAPSSTSKPGAILSLPNSIFAATTDHVLRITTDAAISLDITVYGYEFIP